MRYQVRTRCRVELPMASSSHQSQHVLLTFAGTLAMILFIAAFKSLSLWWRKKVFCQEAVVKSAGFGVLVTTNDVGKLWVELATVVSDNLLKRDDERSWDFKR